MYHYWVLWRATVSHNIVINAGTCISDRDVVVQVVTTCSSGFGAIMKWSRDVETKQQSIQRAQTSVKLFTVRFCKRQNLTGNSVTQSPGMTETCSKVIEADAIRQNTHDFLLVFYWPYLTISALQLILCRNDLARWLWPLNDSEVQSGSP